MAGNYVKDEFNVSVSEESKGGLKYEVVLGEPRASTPTRVASPTNFCKTPSSLEHIQQKLEAAAERRHSLEAEKLASLAAKQKKIEEVSKKRELEEHEFILATKEKVEQKMEAHTESRESKIIELKNKLSNHNTHQLDKARQVVEATEQEKKDKAEKELLSKLEIADKNREKVLAERLETLKKHDEKIEMVRKRLSTSINVEDTETAKSG